MTAVPAVVRWWGGRSDPQRIDLYTRWSFYAAIAFSPLLAVMLVGSAPGPRSAPAVLFLVGSVGEAAAGVLLVRAGLAVRRQGGSRPLRWSLAAAGTAVVTAGAGVAVFGDSSGLPWGAALPLTVALSACATVWSAPRLTLGCAVSG